MLSKERKNHIKWSVKYNQDQKIVEHKNKEQGQWMEKIYKYCRY